MSCVILNLTVLYLLVIFIVKCHCCLLQYMPVVSAYLCAHATPNELQLRLVAMQGNCLCNGFPNISCAFFFFFLVLEPFCFLSKVPLVQVVSVFYI